MSSREALKLLLSLVDTEYPGQLPSKALHDSSLLKSVARLAKANGLFFCLGNRLAELGGDLDFLKEEMLREEKRMQAYLETILLLNKVEAAHGLRYILIKACTSISHVPRDIDVFVSPQDRERLGQILRDSGMKCVYDDPVETSYIGNGYLEVDIYTSIIYGGTRFFDEAFLWQARAQEQNWGIEYPALQPQANYPLVLIHSLLGHRVMSLLDFLHLQTLKRRMETGPSREYAYSMGWGEVFDMAVEQLARVRDRLYSEDTEVSFPYLFKRGFVLKCFSALKGPDQAASFRPSLSLRLSLLLDRVVHELRKTPLYELLERLRFPGRMATRLGLIIRGLRGDRKM